MNLSEALPRWVMLMETIQQEIALLLDIPLTEEHSNWIKTMQEASQHFIETGRECQKILAHQPDFDINRMRFELVTPISPIIGFARMMLMSGYDEISTRQRELLQSIEQSVDTINAEILRLFIEARGDTPP